MARLVCGTCEELCPESEYKLRVKERLLNFFELKNGQKNVPGTLVKSFSRSAAGVKSPKPKNLRTVRCLKRTVEYLLKEILLDKRKSFSCVYDFIFDRLRAVRQEIVIQTCNPQQTIQLLEPMIMFLAYSRYRLCEEPIDNFDPKICDQHLQECLKRVLCCYDEISLRNEECELKYVRNRCFIEALYQMFNLGSIEALQRCIQLPIDIRKDPQLSETFSIALNYLQGNIYRVLIGIKNLPHVLCAIVSVHLPRIRRQLYEMFAHAYNNKQLTVPTSYMCNLLIYNNEKDLFLDCKQYNLSIAEDRKGIRFVKSDFRSEVLPLKGKYEYMVEEKLERVYLSEVLLLKRL